jgi:methylthioribulose-1-phosphate dehydratase
VDRVGLCEALIATGREFHGRGWSLATSSNYSAVVGRQPLRLLITSSGQDKSRLAPADFVTVDERGELVGGSGRPSAETLLHTTIAQHVPRAGAILHTHSVWSTVLSQRQAGRGMLAIRDLEMQKALRGVTTHACEVRLPILDNDQDMRPLATQLRKLFADPTEPLRHGFLLRGHGLYTWGETLDEARRHVEALEFLFEVIGRNAECGMRSAE